MHICRAAEPWLGPGRVRVVLEPDTVQIAAIPATQTAAVCGLVRAAYSNLAPAQNVLETSLGNDNIVLHGPLVLMNAGWIEHTAGQLMIYRDGVTPAVGRVMDAIGTERDNILQAFGFAPRAAAPFYQATTDSRWVQDPCEVGPPDFAHRYISEDIPYGLAPMACLGDLCGLPTSASHAMVELASIVNRADYWKDGLTLKALGLDGLTPGELLERLCDG